MERRKKNSAPEREKRDCMSESVRDRNVSGRWRGREVVEYGMKKKQNVSAKTTERKREGKQEGESDREHEGS